MLNFTQYATLVRAVLLFASGALVSRGILSEAQASYLTDASNISILLGGIGALATFAWSLWARRTSALVSTVAKLPEVSGVAVSPGLAAKVDLPKVVPDSNGGL